MEAAPLPTPAITVANVCQAYPEAAGEAVAGSVASGVTTATSRRLTFSLDSQPASGTVSMSSAIGDFSFVPSHDGRGLAETFVYRVTDETGATATATAKIVYGTRRIWPLGDSITYGIESVVGMSPIKLIPQVDSAIGYRKKLRELLVAEGYAVDFVGTQSAGFGAGLGDSEHDGYLGESTSQIDARIANGLLARVRPDVVLLHVGTNDAVNGNTGIAALDSILARARTYTTDAGKGPLHIALAKIIDQRPDAPMINRMAGFNANLTALYDGRWADPGDTDKRFKVRLADHFAAVDPAAELTPLAQDDLGLHPNAAGYDKMARVWFSTLVENGFVSKCP